MSPLQKIVKASGIVLLFAAIAITFTGCAGVTGTTSKNLSTSPSSLSIDSSTLSFGNVTVSHSRNMSFTATNAGSSSLTVSQLSLTGTEFTFSGVSTPLTLQAGQSATVTVTFAPSSAGSAAGTIQIVSTAANANASVSLSGTGVTTSGQLSASPGTLPVGNVVVGTSGSTSGTLNATGSSVTVTAASTDNSEFTLGGLSLPFTLSAGQSVPYTITFSPKTSGSVNSTLTFTSDAQSSTTTETLTGTGTAAPTHSVALSWNASASSNIAGYNIYRTVYSTSCGSFSKINSTLNTTTLYNDASVADGSTYCYATTAVNTSSQESGYSNIVSNVQIPTP